MHETKTMMLPVEIDARMVPVVELCQNLGIRTSNCCQGDTEYQGYIHCADPNHYERLLTIVTKDQTFSKRFVITAGTIRFWPEDLQHIIDRLSEVYEELERKYYVRSLGDEHKLIILDHYLGLSF